MMRLNIQILLAVLSLITTRPLFAVDSEGWGLLPGPKSKSLDYALKKAKEKHLFVFLIIYDQGAKDWKHLKFFIADGDTESVLKKQSIQVLCPRDNKEIQHLIDKRINDRLDQGDIIYVALTPDQQVLSIGLVFHFRAGRKAMEHILRNRDLLEKGQQPLDIYRHPL